MSRSYTDDLAFFQSSSGTSVPFGRSCSVFSFKPFANKNGLKLFVGQNCSRKEIDISDGFEIYINGHTELGEFINHLKFFIKTMKRQRFLNTKLIDKCEYLRTYDEDFDTSAEQREEQEVLEKLKKEGIL